MPCVTATPSLFVYECATIHTRCSVHAQVLFMHRCIFAAMMAIVEVSLMHSFPPTCQETHQEMRRQEMRLDQRSILMSRSARMSTSQPSQRRVTFLMIKSP